MKRLYLFACVFVLYNSSVRAQWVSISDTNFAAALDLAGYSLCLQGDNISGWQLDTTCPNMVTDTFLDISNGHIHDISGIEYFDNLTSLYTYQNYIDSVHALPPLLKWLSLEWQGDSYTGVTLRYVCDLPPTLETFFCSGNELGFMPALPASLKVFACGTSTLAMLPPLPTGLQVFDCAESNFTVFPALPTGLKELNIKQNLNLSALPPLPPGLVRLECGQNYFTALPPLPSTLRSLDCSFASNLTALPLLPDTLDLLDISYTQITCIQPLKVVKNFAFNNSALTCLPNYPLLNQTTTPALNTLPICDVFNSTGCASYTDINGMVYEDINGNCQYDSAETIYDGLTVQLWLNGSLIRQSTTTNGFYSFATDQFGTYQITIDTTGLPYRIKCPGAGFLTSVLSAADSSDFDMNFAMECKPGFDIEARSIFGSIFRPANFTHVGVKAGATYSGQCATGISGNVTLTLSGPVNYISPANGALTPTVTGNTLTWNVADYSSVNPLTDFNIIVQTDTFAQMNQQVCFTLTANPVAGDNVPSNNTRTQCFTVVNSYDPNDKQVYPNGNIDTNQRELVYTVRFQNTGNAEAQHIYITDTLSSSIDASGFQLLAYSHQPGVQIDGNKVRFNFPNINLPDSTTNEPGSHGHLQYKVRLKDNLAIGTTIDNTAFIYFDFNPPVVTNTTTNTIYIPPVVVKPTSISKYRIQRAVLPAGKCVGCTH